MSEVIKKFAVVSLKEVWINIRTNVKGRFLGISEMLDNDTYEATEFDTPEEAENYIHKLLKEKEGDYKNPNAYSIIPKYYLKKE